jgi:hypothetical protein
MKFFNFKIVSKDFGGALAKCPSSIGFSWIV